MTLIISAPQMLHPKMFESLASQLLSLLSVFMVCQNFLMVGFVSLARLIFRLQWGSDYSVFWQVMIFVS